MAVTAEDKHRLDKWLWFVRIFKTRTPATDACARGKATCNGQAARASRSLKPGDIVEVRTENRKWKVRVMGLPEKRLPHADAILCYEDLAPPGVGEGEMQASAFHQGGNQVRQGRPTKKQRRDLRGFTGD
ncbi:MAG TPA: RNA-binding S4 domain-containing protein [Chitinophagaceae bacterium]|nr:RNA-binding S4 domain-containing protein [Chitinophagaceae bacterium]